MNQTLPQFRVTASIAYQRSKAKLHWHTTYLIVRAPDATEACTKAKSAWSISGHLVRKPVATPGPTCTHPQGFPVIGVSIASCPECHTPRYVYLA